MAGDYYGKGWEEDYFGSPQAILADIARLKANGKDPREVLKIHGSAAQKFLDEAPRVYIAKPQEKKEEPKKVILLVDEVFE